MVVRVSKAMFRINRPRNFLAVSDCGPAILEIFGPDHESIMIRNVCWNYTRCIAL